MKVPFGKTFKVTPAQLKDGIAEGLRDGYQDLDGAYKSRPGLTQWSDIGADGVDGLYVDNNGRTVGVSGGIVYIIDQSGNATACTGSTLNVGTLCTFAEDFNNVFIAHGGYLAMVDTGAKTVTLLSAGTILRNNADGTTTTVASTAPASVSHVIFLQGYILCNGNSGLPGDTFYTGPNTVFDYLTGWEVYNNESLPDGCPSLMEDGQFVYAFGSRSVEVSVNNGVEPWARYSMTYIPYGIHAPHSVAKIDNTFFWLGAADNALRILKMDNGHAVTISTPYDAVINTLPTTSDAYGFSVGILGHSFYVLQFPTEDLTLVYHVQNDAWYQWSFYDITTASYKAFKGRCHTYHATINKNLVGCATGGTIAELAGFSDLGALIRAELTSGNVTGGTYKQKRAGRMRFQLLRGTTTSATAAPVVLWQHRDDGGKWSPERRIPLGSLGQYGYLGQLDRNGIYRERQHRIVMTDTTCQLVFVDVEEDTKLLGD